MYFFPSHSGILDKKQNHSESCSNKWSFGICMRGQFLYTHVQSRALVWLNVIVIVTLLIPFVFSTEWENEIIDNTKSPNTSYVSFWPMPIAYCIKQWPLGEWPTRCLARQATYYIYSDQIKINRGWPIGLTDCNYDHIQGFIKITNMMEKSPLKKLVHTCRGRVIKAILVFIITYKCPRNFYNTSCISQ